MGTDLAWGEGVQGVLTAIPLIAFAVVTETVFAWPGIGRLLVDAIFQRDYPLVQASILFITASFIFINLLVDISYVYIDPRIKLK